MVLWLGGFAALLALLLGGVPVGFAMAIVGAGGAAAVIGLQPALTLLGQIYLDTGMSYTLVVVPLFVLMGNLVAGAGLADDLYAASDAWLRHRRGGLAMATIAACGAFSSVCGSSLATAATMARVAMPPMRRHGYSDALAAGSVAAGGTLGVLIPPSIILVLYGTMTETDIGRLFLAGILPGAIGILGYLLAVRLSLAWSGERPAVAAPLPMLQRLAALRGVSGVLTLFAVVIGGIYLGVFTTAEAAGIGASGALVAALARRRLTAAGLLAVLVDTARTTAMLLFVLFGPLAFSTFVNLAGLPAFLADSVGSAGLGPTGTILVILVVYLVLGMLMESLSMLLLTVPVFHPLVAQLGFDLTWFGIVVVVAAEISFITPPVGMNVFVLRSMLPAVPTATIFRGVMPFVLIDLLRLLLIVFVPWLALVVPRTM